MEPSPEPRESLLSSLAEVIASHGEPRFVSRVLLEPTSEFFPDAWSPDDDGVFALMASVFRHAGLEDLTVSLTEHEAEVRRVAQVDGVRSDGTKRIHDADGPARLVSYDAGGECVISIDPRGREHPDMLAASLCRLASRLFLETRAAPYRSAAGARRETSPRDVELVSLYLGYGVLLANDAYTIFREPRTVVHRTAGALGLEGTCFLLAAELCVRALPSRVHDRVLRSLAANQANLVSDYLDAIDADAVAAKLLPSRARAAPTSSAQ